MPFTVQFRPRGIQQDLKEFAETIGAGGKKDRFRLEVLGAMRKQGTLVKNELQKTTNNWANHSVKWRVSTAKGSLRFNAREIKIDIEGSGDIDIWGYLDRGTSVKYGRPGPGFHPKTRPGYFGSDLGSGEWINDGTVNQNGIEARLWTEEISGNVLNDIQGRFTSDVANRFESLAREFGAR